jgi:predicted permease
LGVFASAAGAGSARADAAADVLNKLVIYVSLPALVLKLTGGLSFERSMALLVVVPWLVLAAGAALVLAAARAFHWSRATLAALLLCVPLGNTSFLGFPLIAALLGPNAVRYAVIYDQLGSFLILSTYGLAVIARFQGGAPPSPAAALVRLAKFPPFIALVLGCLPWTRPALLRAVITPLGDMLVPLAMFAVGLKLELRPRALAQPGALAFGLFTKMLVLPLLVALGLRAFGGTHGEAARVAVLEAGMPPMISAGALAAMAGLAPELAAALVGYGVLLALISVPLLAGLLG